MEDETHKREMVIKEAVVSLDIILRRLQNQRYRVTSRAEALFKELIEVQAKGNSHKASNFADAVAQYRTLAQKLYYGEILLEKARIRLETISLLGPISEELRVAGELMSEVRVVFTGIGDVNLTEMDRIRDQVSEIIEATRVHEEQVPQIPESRSEEVSQIISEASTLAAERIAKEFPHVPLREEVKAPAMEVERLPAKGETSLEDRLFKYLNERSGQYSPEQAAKELNASREDISKALRSLSEKGKIVLDDFEEEGAS
jgi:division protein CdvB (Snf7/Vps24/ESCRT-III family)